MTPPTIVFLNGTSSSGKTSIVSALQAILDEPYLTFSADLRKPMLPPFRQGLGWEVSGILDRLRQGYYGCLVALVEAGNYVIADQAMEDPAWIFACAETLKETRTYFIGVRCELNVALQREQARGDRTIGLVAEQHDKVHQLGMYDFEVDSSEATPEDCAEQIKAYIGAHEPFALAQLREKKKMGG
ncbi:MAG: zeta toxin family protein [Armatimonas sp.]